MLGDRQTFLRAVIVPEIITQMMSLDLQISYDSALDLLYDEQVNLYGRLVLREPEVRSHIDEFLGKSIPQTTDRGRRGRNGK
jgi:hypothetical protein